MDQQVKSALERIPGYAGYRRKEDRRDDDKRIRNEIADALSTQVDTLTRRNAALVEARALTQVSRIERVIGQIRLLADRIRTATYGYGGLFSENSVDELVLDQIRQFDLALQREIATLAKLVTTPSDVDLEQLQGEVSRLGELVDARTQVVDTAKPHQDTKVLSLLDTNPAPEPSPLLSVALGDTFSVLGDNYQTDAIMTLVDGDIRIHMARVGENAEGAAQWFVASSTPEIPTSLLVEAADGTLPIQPMRSAAANVQSAKGKREGVSAQYSYTAGETPDGQVAFSYTIGDEARHLTGRRINDMDIEFFGAAHS
jgi:hypothetical protein